MKGTTLQAAVVLACAILAPAAAWGHAFLDHADPRVGSTVAAAPAALTLTFTEPIEPAFSRVTVSDAAGKQVNAGPLQHPAADTVRIPLPSLSSGVYAVEWSVVSVDTHHTEGRFTFTVRGP